jgi:hypothetical protein
MTDNGRISGHEPCIGDLETKQDEGQYSNLHWGGWVAGNGLEKDNQHEQEKVN